MLLSWSCKICMARISHLMNVCPQHSYLSLCNSSPTCFILSPAVSSLLPCCSTSRPSLTSLPTPWSLTHAHMHTHTHYSDIRTHSWAVCGNGRSVLRPCWGAADWSCTDLPPGPWGFVTHICGAGLNTFSLSLSPSVFCSLSFCLCLSPLAFSLAMQCSVPHAPAPLALHLSQCSANNRFPFVFSVLIFFQFCFLWLILSFHLLNSALSLVILSLKSLSSPFGFPFLLHFYR